MIYFEPRTIYDAAILYTTDTHVVYDYYLLIDAIMICLSCDYHDAVDWYCYNIECVYIEGWPMVVCDDD